MIDYNEKIATLAEEWYKAKVGYKHRGASRFGCDCGGLIIGILKEIGFLKKYKMPIYSHDWNLHKEARERLKNAFEEFSDVIPRGETKRGDIVIFTFGQREAHCGIVTKGNLFIHNLSTERKCAYGYLVNSMWSRRWSATRRFNEEKAILIP